MPLVRILQDTELCELIKRKFAIKNTTGYSINALLDFGEIKDIVNHLFIGAEGTLGFVSSVEYECVEDYAFKACALLFYKDLALGAKAVEILARNESFVSAAEIMDYACLDSAKSLENAPSELEKIQSGACAILVQLACAILVQLESSTQKELDSKIAYISKELESVPSLFGVHFSSDEKLMASWWKIRKALLPLAAGTRPSGSIVITEDICFPIHTFAQGIDSITKLFDRFNFQGIIFGHALSGNVHFIITPNLNDEKESQAFAGFMEAMVDSVISLQGSTKAEHGTGRMIAPFVEKEWGAKAYAINRRIKEIFDPHSLINPDVIISDNPQIHTQNLKQSSEVEDFINQCMECGFCEKVCPSRELTLTPRQRIAVRKEIARLEALLAESTKSTQKPTQEILEELKRGYQYFGIETCATCSMCSLSCPLEIDSAKIAQKLSPSTKGAVSRFIATQTAKHFSSTLSLAKGGLHIANFGFAIFGKNTLSALSKKIKFLPYIPRSLPRANAYKLESKNFSHSHHACRDEALGARVALPQRARFLPYIPRSLPRANAYKLESKNFSHSHHACRDEALGARVALPQRASPTPLREQSNAWDNGAQSSQISVIYFSTCINRSFAPQSHLQDTRALQEVFESLCEKARVSVVYPQNLSNLCCGKAYKDYPQNAEIKRKEVYRALDSSVKELQSKGAEQIHIVCDHSACSYELKSGLKELDSTLTILDMPEFIESTLLPRLTITPLDEDIALYAMCATRKGKWDKSLESIAKTCTNGEVIIHSKTQCCGFAGNKGFICSELNASALRELSEFYKDRKLRLGFSSSSTCEIGLNDKTNITWQNLLYLVDSVSASGDK